MALVPTPSAVAREGADAPRWFASPPTSARPGVFYFWPDPVQVDDARIRRDVQDIASVGFGAAKMVAIPITPGSSVDGWGTAPWREHVEQALLAARRSATRLDITIGPEWPISSPTVTEELSQQSLLYATTSVDGGQTFGDRPPFPDGVVGSTHLVAVTAARVAASGDPEPGTTTLDPSSAIDLTDRIGADGKLAWQAPPGQWLVFGFWQRATGQTVPNTSFPTPTVQQMLARPVRSGPNAWLVPDHFRRESVDTVLDYIGQAVGGRVGDLLRGSGANVFEDSLELKGSVLWTRDLPREFARRRGYAIARYLPGLFVRGNYTGQAFEFTGDVGARIRHDYDETLTDLYVERHLRPQAKWARDRGLTFRAQAGYFSANAVRPSLGLIRSARSVPVPETETLGWGDPAPYGSAKWRHALDGYRATASGAHLSGAREVSIELGDALFAAYGLNPIDYKQLIDKAYSAGITQIYMHGVAYPDAPGGPAAAGYGWPGWSPFEFGPFAIAGISEAWSSNYPQWSDWPSLTAYMGRARQILERGRPAVDIAIYKDGGFAPADSQPVFEDPALSAGGYTYDFVDGDALLLPAARRVPGRLFGDGPAYGALVIDNQMSMPASAAHAIDALAARGLPVLVVGQAPSHGSSQRDPADEDAVVSAAFERVLTRPNALQVSDEAGVAKALRRLGVTAGASFAAPTDVLTVRRRDATADYWFLNNPTPEAITVEPTFATRGAPTQLDLWNGTSSPVALWRRTAGGIDVPLTLPPHGSTVLAFGRDGRYVSPHATETDAQQVVAADGRLELWDTRGGTRRVTLSDGFSRTLRLGVVPATQSVDRWALTIDEALPAGTATHRIMLDGLTDWSALPGLADASGVGRYSATVTVPRDWLAKDRGVMIDVGDVEGAMQLRVNGRRVTAQTTPGGRWSIGALLRPGHNRITVRLATTLRNRILALAASGDPLYVALGSLRHQRYGLLGPVRLIPFARAPVATIRGG